MEKNREQPIPYVRKPLKKKLITFPHERGFQQNVFLLASSITAQTGKILVLRKSKMCAIREEIRNKNVYSEIFQ